MRVKKKPQRSCVVCRETFDKRELKRIVRTPEGGIHYDPTGKASGRGAYICNKPECREAFSTKNFLERAFRQSVSSDTVNQVREELRTHADKTGEKQ